MSVKIGFDNIHEHVIGMDDLLRFYLLTIILNH